MIEFKCLFLVLAKTLCFVQGQMFEISTEFMNGDLIFTWTNVSSIRNDFRITNDNQTTKWMLTYEDQYRVKDVLKYKSVAIKVREYNFTDFSKGHVDYIKTYKVVLVEAKEGESRNISWTAEYFPEAGFYRIFHNTHNGSRSRIIKITKDAVKSTGKYVYHSQPLNSVDILFEVKNITVEDAGYYVGGVIRNDDDIGVILVVHGKPRKPTIEGQMTIKVGKKAFLECVSRSTSSPYYYKMFPPFSYSWYVNNTRIDGETRETYYFSVSKDVKYNRYSCQVKETVESDRSEEVKLNPLYLSEPNIYINGLREKKLSIPKNTPLRLSCLTEGNPIPTVKITRGKRNQILERTVNNWLNYTFPRKAQCTDSNIYRCQGSSKEFQAKAVAFSINISCNPRLDNRVNFKSTFYIRDLPSSVYVKVPIISNPSPRQVNWYGALPNYGIRTTISRRNEVYQHWVSSTIPIDNESFLGNYTCIVHGEGIELTTIEIREIEIDFRASSSQWKLWIVVEVFAGLFVLSTIISIICKATCKCNSATSVKVSKGRHDAYDVILGTQEERDDFQNEYEYVCETELEQLNTSQKSMENKNCKEDPNNQYEGFREEQERHYMSLSN